MTSSWK